MRGRFAESFGGVARVARNPNLRRLQTAWALVWIADWSYMVAIGIFAFRAGGAVAVGIVGVVRMIPSAVVVPFASSLGDRRRRDRVLLWLEVAWAAALAASAVAFYAEAPHAVVYGLAGVVGVVSTVFRPTLSSLLPWLAVTPEELVASNVAAATIESLGTLIGPILGGVLAAAADPGAVFVAGAGASVLAAVSLGLIRPEGTAMPRGAGQRTGLLAEAMAGFAEVRRNRSARLVVLLFGAQSLVRGALNVLIVVIALDLLDIGNSGVGFLAGALGAGGLVGSIIAMTLVGRRLAVPFGIGLLLWGAPIALIGAAPSRPMALLCLAAVGAGNAIGDVSGLTLIQRVVPDRVLARVYGALFGVAMGAIGIGSIALPPVLDAIGSRPTLLAAGALLPLATLAGWRGLREIDRTAAVPTEQLGLLRRVPMFAGLSVAATEHLAASFTRLEVAAGSEVIRQGEVGDRFYLLASGEAEVTRDGKGIVACTEPGEYFGEIALLRDVPRTATVRTVADSVLYSLEREEFLGALAGHAAAREIGDRVAEQRLSEFPGIAET